jgi:hypothetical protein
VKYYSHRLDSVSKGKAKSLLIIAKKPDKAEPYYWVQVGNNSGGRFIARYNFFVYKKKGLEVKFYDTMNDSIITLQEWRK